MSSNPILVGLGNPGDRYRSTRHNLGFMVLDHLAETHRARWTCPSPEYLQARISLSREPLLLVKPQTYVNLSGTALIAMRAREEMSPERLLVVCDDFNLPLGTMRLRRSGSDGGHNGLLSIIDLLATTAFARLRIGIGPLPPGLDPADFVLEAFEAEEMKIVRKTLRIAGRCVEDYLEFGIEHAMSRFNTRLESPESD